MTRRALRSLLHLVVLVAIGVSLGLGVSIIYADYLYSPYGSLTCLHVSSSSSNGDAVDAVVDSSGLFEEVARWAKSRRVTVLYRSGGGFVQNFGVCCGSSLLEDELGITGFAAGGPQGAFVKDDEALLASYVSDGTLLPGVLDLPVLGVFEQSSNIEILNSADFFYPLSAALGYSGALFTDAVEVEELQDIFEDEGLSADIYSQPLLVTLSQLPQLLLETSDYSRCLLIALICLPICYVYVILDMCRSSLREIEIRHILGLSLRGSLLRLALVLGSALVVQMAALSLFLACERSYLGAADLLWISLSALLLYLLLDALACVLSQMMLRRRLGKKGWR